MIREWLLRLLDWLRDALDPETAQLRREYEEIRAISLAEIEKLHDQISLYKTQIAELEAGNRTLWQQCEELESQLAALPADTRSDHDALRGRLPGTNG